MRSPFSKDDDLVFPKSRGTYTSHTNFLKRDWAGLFDAMDEAHAEDSAKPPAPARFNWHHLRHFSASCWIEAGLQPKTVQTFIGHATLAMTMDLYGHLFKSDSHQRAMDDIAGAVFS
jgi:integrase